MARIEWVEQRLLAWAAWLTVGDGNGYPALSVLHEDWSPPSPGTTPTMKVGVPQSARQTHAAVLQLSERMQKTLRVHYVQRLPLADQAEWLGCQPGTVYARVEAAHAALAAVMQHRTSRVDSGILV